MAGREITVADVWSRFGDTGRFGLITAAVLLPLKRRDFDGNFNAATSILTSAAVCKAVKPFVPELRPNREDTNSFPSQHAAESFAAGLALRRYFGWAAGTAEIGVATLVATSRLFAKKHYAVDLVAGIAIGAASTIAVEAFESRQAAAGLARQRLQSCHR
jgi:membrane-associated phospholipid phosphatase